MIETAQQWDDEWWRIWEVARADKLDGEASAAVADREMSERHGLRPAETPAAVEVITLASDGFNAAIGELLHGRTERGWLTRLLDRMSR